MMRLKFCSRRFLTENCKEKQDNTTEQRNVQIKSQSFRIPGHRFLLPMAAPSELRGSGNLPLRKGKEGTAGSRARSGERRSPSHLGSCFANGLRPAARGQDLASLQGRSGGLPAGVACSSPQPGVKTTSCPQNAFWNLPMSCPEDIQE